MSIGLGMCPSGQWQKLSKTAWVKSMSPYEHRILDMRMPPDPSRSIEVSTEEGASFPILESMTHLGSGVIPGS